MKILVLNPGGNSLKAEIVSCDRAQRWAFEGRKDISVIIEGIGKSPELRQVEEAKSVSSEAVSGKDYGEATMSLIRWLRGRQEALVDAIEYVAVRVVHGGLAFQAPAIVDAEVEQKIIDLERLAPLHNKSSVELLGPVRSALPGVPICAVFDSAFHRSMPDHAALYAIAPELSEKHAIRRYGFHGISHRYLLERYAHLAGKSPEQCSLVSMHLESGCSVTAIRNGKSIDNTMGLTPLEGLMMGTRSGDVDPSLVGFLMTEEGMSVEEVMELLNKKSGLLAVSGISLDTRVLLNEYESNSRVRLAISMFSYRVRKAVGAALAALGKADAVIFGGGIAENAKLIRADICEGLESFGFRMDAGQNEKLIDQEGRLSTTDSSLQAWVIPTQEGLQMAHECLGILGKESGLPGNT